jgi:hypothetical protein
LLQTNPPVPVATSVKEQVQVIYVDLCFSRVIDEPLDALQAQLAALPTAQGGDD